MKPNAEQYKTVAFVDSYKEANKNTVQKVKKYDPKLRLWILETVSIDENAFRFSEEQRKNRRRKSESEKKEKKKTVKKIAVLAKSPAAKTQRTMPVKPRSEMRLNVVRLHKSGMKFKEIGNMYNVSENSARLAYHKEIQGK